MGSANLVPLARVWKHPRISRLQIEVNPRLKSTLARWMPPGDVVEISPVVRGRGLRVLREVISHEAAHVVVWDRSVARHGHTGQSGRRSCGRPASSRERRCRCGHATSRQETVRVRHFCPVCHFSRFAKQRMPRWRCPECRAIGLEGELTMERVTADNRSHAQLAVPVL